MASGVQVCYNNIDRGLAQLVEHRSPKPGVVSSSLASPAKMIMNIIKRIQQELLANTDAKTKASSSRFFKEHVQSYGVKIPVVNQIAKRFLVEIKAAQLSKSEIFILCDQLWQSNILEEALVACIFSESQLKHYTPEDFAIFEKWVKNYVSNWATCDTLCNHTVGNIVAMYPELAEKLLVWAKSDNRWVKRAAAVSLIVPARQGLFLDKTLQIANILILDPDDLVQKGYGWMLKAASMSEPAAKGDEETKNKHTIAVFDYVMKNKHRMPRTALRYAIEKMPPDLKKQAMAR